ncbi:MAG TPA: serine hydrolase [Candidatus Saccharimonadales bacterium]|jgi:beta-lactamase class A|nr:serine hydrolase [Candidatus Saccharimonadales bacterium]
MKILRSIMITFGILLALGASIVYATRYVEAREAADAQRAAEQHMAGKLTSALTAIIAAHPDTTTSVAITDLDTDKAYDVGSSAAFTAASTTKVLTATDYLHQVELGSATLDQTIDGDTAQDLLQRMIQQSDNDAWVALNDYLTYTQMSDYAHSLGLDSYDWQTNAFTAKDEASLLTQLAKGTLVSDEHRTLLYSYMQNTSDDDLIPAALPSSATVYHKYGELDGDLHDAAIITYKGHHFVLVIYTNNPEATLDDYDARTTLIHDLTTAVVHTLVA